MNALQLSDIELYKFQWLIFPVIEFVNKISEMQEIMTDRSWIHFPEILRAVN